MRRVRAVCGWASGSNVEGDATIPASSADSHGARTEAQVGRGIEGVLSPQPGVDCPGTAWESKPWTLPKYTRAADSTPYAPLPK